MMELNLMKQMWNISTSDSENTPVVGISTNTTRTGTRTFVDINGILSNAKIPSDGSSKMVGTSAWMTYPISMYDTTKVNFTLSWDNLLCPISINNPLLCSSQGGFAVVFQQESLNALGEFQSNLGEGLSYNGLSGILAIEFDTMASIHNGESLSNNLVLSVQTKNPITQLLSARPSMSIAKNTNPINFGSFNRSDFSPKVNVSIGLIPNQLQQEFILSIFINGIPQIQKKISFSDVGIEPNRVYYFGFTGAQNLNLNVATGTLSLQNIRIFKSKPKFVDGQVSYLYDFSDRFGNNSYLEVRSSFYDLCMEKTTFAVYPTTSILDWQSGNETDPKILSFLYNRDVFVTGSIINPLMKPQFYKPYILQLTADVKFTMSIPTARTQAIRMGFYWGKDLIMNITAIDYFRQQVSNAFAFIVIENSDIITGTLSVKGYANNNYQFNIYCYDKGLNTAPVPFSTLQLTVTSDYIRLNDTVYSNLVPTTCYGVQSQSNNGGYVIDTSTSYFLFTCTFLPNVNGTYYINSPYLPSGRSFKVDIAQADQVTKILSSENSQAIIQGDFVMNVSSVVEIYIDLRDYLNNTYQISTDDGCTFTKSYYTQNGQKYSFLFYDGFPYLRTQITRAGVADFRITISCSLLEFDLQCFRCQKLIQPLTQYYYYKMSIPAFPSQFDISLSDNSAIMLPKGSSLVVDFTFFDIYDNVILNEVSDYIFNNSQIQFVYMNRTARRIYNMTKLKIPGKIMFQLTDSDNQFFKSLPARTNTYFLQIQVPTQQTCFTLDFYNKTIYLVNQDKLAPIDMIGDQDLNIIEPLLTQIYWDRTVQANRIGRFAFTIRNPNMMQLNYWPTQTIGSSLDARIFDSANINQNGTNCLTSFGNGLYEGEYFGWFQCKPGLRFYNVQLVYYPQSGAAILLGSPFQISIVQANASSVDATFYQSPTGTLFSGSGGLNIQFRLYDDNQNVVDNLMIDRAQPQFGVITYNLTQINTGVVVRFANLPLVNSSSGACRIFIENVPIGQYRLQLNIPSLLTTDVRFNSNSRIVSPFYSFASREGSQTTVLVNSYVTIKIFARNIHNQTISNNTDSPLIISQCRVYLVSSFGYHYHMSFGGTFNETARNLIYYNFTTVEPLRRNGQYFSTVYFPDSFTYLYVDNGTFQINDRFDPLSSELYLIKGIEQKEFRMIQYDPLAGLGNSFNATHYDPRIDGSLRFKLYLRTNINNDLVSNADFTNVNFQSVFITGAQYQSTGSFQMTTNYSNINLRIQTFNQEFLLITPASWADQDLISALPESYYFLFIQGIQFSNGFQLQWIFSLFNSDNGPNPIQTQMNFYAPRFINITAGEPFTFVCAAYGNKAPISINVVVANQGGLLSTEIDTTSNNQPPGFIYYVTLYHETVGIYYPSIRADTLPTREIIVQVNPAPFYQVRISDPSQITARTLNIGAQVSFNFTMVDRYGNSIFSYGRENPPAQRIFDMVQVIHWNRKPILKFVRPVAPLGVYQANFTTQYAGIVGLVVPFTSASVTQTFTQALSNFTFIVPQSTLPSAKTSFAFMRQKSIWAGSFFQLQVQLFDEYENKLNAQTNLTSLFIPNLVPDANCNLTTQVIPFFSFSLDQIVFQLNLTRACLYTVNLYYMSPTDGQQTIQCLNCYLRVFPSAEEYRRFDFIDSRDQLVNAFNPNGIIYINKYDWNPKLIMIMRDLYGNLVTTQTKDQMAFNYTFELIQRGGTTVFRNGTWDQLRSFHLISFCNEAQLRTFCMQPDWTTASLRIRQLNKATGAVLGIALINVQFVDNYGASFYNADQLNQLSRNYTYIRVMNQDMIETLGQDLPIIPNKCIGGSQYPIIGRIELRTFQGFRINDTFANLQSRLSISILNVSSSRYSFQFYPGNTQGLIYFILFVNDDFFTNQASAIAQLTIDGEFQTYKQIVVQCEKKLNYSKYVVQNNGSYVTRLSDGLVSFQAGDSISINLTSISDQLVFQPSLGQFLPYDTAIYLNQSNQISYSPISQFTVVNDPVNMIQTYKFSPLTRAGIFNVNGSGISDNFSFNFYIVAPGLISAAYTTVSNEQLRIGAGQNATIFISPADRYGNPITITNLTSDLQYFNNYTQVYYTKLGNQMTQPEQWEMAQSGSCFDVIQGRVRCSMRTITNKGMYRFRVVINGEIASCINCYLRVVATGNISLSKTVVTDLSQNFQQNQLYAMGKFNMFPRSNYIYMKAYLEDEWDNVYMHEDLTMVETIWPKLTNTTVDTNLTIVRIGSGKATNALLFKITVVQSTASFNQFSFTREGLYSLRLVTNRLGIFSYPIFIMNNRASQGYQAPAGSIPMLQTKDNLLQQRAGRFESLQFGIFVNKFLLLPASTDLTQVQLSNPIPSSNNLVLQNGIQIVAQYKGIYEKFQRFMNVTYVQQYYHEKYTVTINGFTQLSSSQFFQTIVFPGQLSQIQYSPDGTTFRAMDAIGNDVDYSTTNLFSLQVISQQSMSRWTPANVLANEFQLKMNYTQRVGVIVSRLQTTQNISTIAFVDSIQNIVPNVLMGYSPKNMVSFERSSFSYQPYSLISGRTIQVYANIVDNNLQPVNLTGNTNALSNLTVRLVQQSFLSPDQYQARVVRTINFLGATLTPNRALMLNIQFNQSAYYYIEVRYYNVSLQNANGNRNCAWVYVDVDPNSGISSDQQWTLSMIAVQRNKIYSPLTTTSGVNYVSYMKSQPIYFVARLGDRFGNPFQSPQIYAFYNVGDTALSSRIRNYGDTRQLNLNTQFIWNFMTISANEQLNRALIRQYVPSLYPFINNAAYDNQKSYKIDMYSPSNSTQNINLKVIYLVITSDFPIDTFHSVNVTNNRAIDMRSTGLFSPDFDDGLQIKIRQNIKNLITIHIRNTDNRPYLAEPITGFTLQVTNTTQVNMTIGGRNVTTFQPLNTTSIFIIPYVNDGFFRVLINSSTLYQDPYPLNARATIRTLFTYNVNNQSQNLPLWVFPQTPPNFLNTITNTSYLARNQTKFQPATKIVFLLSLRNNGTVYMNDLQSAQRIKVFRKSSIEQVKAQLINKTTYSVSVNLEGPQTNQFRIYYQDTNGALYPLIQPDVISFEINSGPALLSSKLSHSNFERFYYSKLGQQEWMNSYQLQSLPLKQNLAFVRLVLIPNMVQGSPLTYFIGNEFRTSILVVDSQTSRCLLSSNYNPYTDIQVKIQRYDPMTGSSSRISIDVDSINLVQKVVSQSTSYCTYYSIAVLESSDQLNSQGNYSLTATFLPTQMKSNFTFQAKVSGIDFTKTTIGWYQQSATATSQEKLIAQINSYDDFNYLIYFMDVQGNYVNDRQEYVEIQIKFDQQQLTEQKDYQYISRYDDRFKGYLITISFQKAGSFQPEYYFNLQRAENIQVKNGPILFVVSEPQCAQARVLSVSPSTSSTSRDGKSATNLMMGQLFTMVFHCFDLNGKEILSNIDGIQAQAVFRDISSNDQTIFVSVDSLQNGIYRVSQKFYTEGTYNLKIYFNNLLIYQDNTKLYQVISEQCKDSTTNPPSLLYRCPSNPQICANNYFECNYLNSQCTNPLSPFLCGPGGSSSNKCVSNMQSECCKINDRTLPDFKWCPHLNQCINTTLTQCQSNSYPTPYFCQSTQTFVDKRTSCCQDFKYNVTMIVNATNYTIVTKSMVKCSYEDKCVPEDTAQFCFFSFKRNCAEIFGPEYSYQCPNDGKCRRSALECPSSRVCPPGYTQCPDYTCIKGLNAFSQCSSLQNCTDILPDGSVVNYIRCPDGSCSRTYEDCPSQVSCMIQSQVVCPDGSCKYSEYECTQPNECTSDKPIKCPGFPSTCATSLDLCPQPSSKSCGGTLSLCANGDCSNSCKKSLEYNNPDQNVYLATLSMSCDSQGLVQCPNFECRSSFLECSDTLFCPVPINYTYSPQTIICPGSQICALNRQDCFYSQCESTLNLQFLPVISDYDHISVNQQSLQTCYDGRCHYEGLYKQDVCMTPISCSLQYTKSGGFGEYCISSLNTSTALMELSILLNDYQCSGTKVKCVTGECRNSLNDCPSQITCPESLPIQCRDGQCVKSKTLCQQIDIAIEKTLLSCFQLGLLLCTSDLITCTDSLSKCPSRSSCPIGFIKCWDESCVNLNQGQQCPNVISSLTAEQQTLSTCPDQYTFPFHCFADGSCRASLQDCPSISYCPPERPVKCAADNSCRKSIINCPSMITCQAGYKYCSGEGTCIPSFQICGTPITCPEQAPLKCEDGTCVSVLNECFTNSHSLSNLAKKCVEDETQYLCFNNQTRCGRSIYDCPSSMPCLESFLVKAPNNQKQTCYQSRRDFTSFSIQQLDLSQCSLNNMYRCESDGQCSDKPCDQWLNCPDSQFKCWDGTCVTDQKYCKRRDTGCPVYAPFKCNYTANCVANISQCQNSDAMNALVTNICNVNFGLKVACPYDGSCAQTIDQCNSQPIACNTFPNHYSFSDQCFIQICPEQYPFKCSNGLCVTKESDCPLSPYSISEIQYCSLISQQSGLDFFIPCGNGHCVERADQCQPLFDCSLNLNSDSTMRCPDGTCRANLSQCPQYVSSTSFNTCPTHIPYLCSNGMCAFSQQHCLSNDNGCPQGQPLKCPQTGQCVSSMIRCQTPIQDQQEMFIYPNQIPPISSTPLIMVYGKIRSICQAVGQFTCRLGEIPFCVDRLDDCIQNDNNCPVNRPIRCGNQCLTSYFDCIGESSDNCTAQKTQRCKTGSQTGGQCSISPQDWSNCLTNQGCPSNAQSFKCSSQKSKKASCAALPYSSFSVLNSATCRTFDSQQSISLTSINSCSNSDFPYSCSDGSCASSISQCPTCIHYCPQILRCVRSPEECYLAGNSTDLKNQISNKCPLSTPVRCILTGKCVKYELDCSVDDIQSIGSNFNYTFSGALLSPKCPFMMPIKCQDGRCVSQYDECIRYQRVLYNKSTSSPLWQPLQWGNSPNFMLSKSVINHPNLDQQPCQVICYDGSCRDRVENCPIISGCFDPIRPYRCKSGFCAMNQSHCMQLFSSMEIPDSNLGVSNSCNDELGDKTTMYRRCEDGICRPLIPVLNTTTKEVMSYNDTCLPFMGCPNEAPFHCPNGDCVQSIEQCAGSSECPVDRRKQLSIILSIAFRCKNFKCVSQMNQCDRPHSTIKSLQLDRTFDPLQETLINFAFDKSGYVVGKLIIPSNAIDFNSTGQAMSQLQTLQTIQTYPVPDSILEQVQNEISKSRISYASRIYSLVDNQFLNRSQTILSSVVKIEMAGEAMTQRMNLTQIFNINNRYLQETSQIIIDDNSMIRRPLYLYFKVDRQSIPSVLNIQEDICLGKVYNQETLASMQQLSFNYSSLNDSALPRWQCESRLIKITDDDYFKFKINTLGIYALIVNPNPDTTSPTSLECGFLCRNHLIILIVSMSLVLLSILFIYTLHECCKTRDKTLSQQRAEDKKMQMMMLANSHGDSFFAGLGHSIRNNMPAFLTQEAFLSDPVAAELDIDRVKEVLDSVDPQDPPLMPGQVVMYLTNQHDQQNRQIEELKCQLQEQNERERENLKLIKRIFQQKQLIYEQMQVSSDIKSQSRKNRSMKAKKRKEAINDPSIKKEYEDIEAYLTQILSETHLPDPFDPKASQATFQNYPGVNTLRIQPPNPADQSQMSIPADQIYPVGNRGGLDKNTNPLNTSSMKHLFAAQKNSQSTTDLEIKESNLKRKAADMLLKNNLGVSDDVEEFKYEERAAQHENQLRHNSENIMISDHPEDADRVINNLQRDAQYQPINDLPHRPGDDEISGLGGLDQATLSKTMNQLFSKALKKGPSTGYNMLMGNSGAVSGTVSGNIVKGSGMERVRAQKYQQDIAASGGSNQKQKSLAAAFDGEDSDESDDNLIPFDEYEKRRAAANSSKGSTPHKK